MMCEKTMRLHIQTIEISSLKLFKYCSRLDVCSGFSTILFCNIIFYSLFPSKTSQILVNGTYRNYIEEQFNSIQFNKQGHVQKLDQQLSEIHSQYNYGAKTLLFLTACPKPYLRILLLNIAIV